MQAIILVGGFGTRLRAVLPDVPKPMAPLHDKPFLAYLLDYLHAQGITDVIFSVHYLREKIQAYFHTSYAGLTIQYAEEEQPLGTGGAIVNALSLARQDEPIFVLNGDTFIKLNYQAMHAQHQQTQASMTMALRAVDEGSRYGRVVTENNIVTAFREKGEHGPALINAGVYLIHPTLFTTFALPTQFSIETDFLFPHAATIKPHAFITHDYFIDIGIPEDYARALQELPALRA